MVSDRVPRSPGAGEAQRTDETGEDDFTLAGGDDQATDDAAPPEPAAARRAFFPSSIGLSLLVPASTRQLRVIVHWGDYRAESRETEEAAQEKPSAEALGRGTLYWKRTPRQVELALDLPSQISRTVEHEVPDSAGVRLAVSVRPVKALGIAEGMVPPGTRLVSVFLVNHRPPALVADPGRDGARSDGRL